MSWRLSFENTSEGVNVTFPLKMTEIKDNINNFVEKFGPLFVSRNGSFLILPKFHSVH